MKAITIFAPDKLSKATIRKNEHGEFVVRFYSNGVLNPNAHYYATDLEDAKGTAYAELYGDSINRNPVIKTKRNPSSGVRIVHNKLLGGWYIVRGPHQTPIGGRFNSKAEAQAHLQTKAYSAEIFRQANEHKIFNRAHKFTATKKNPRRPMSQAQMLRKTRKNPKLSTYKQRQTHARKVKKILLTVTGPRGGKWFGPWYFPDTPTGVKQASAKAKEILKILVPGSKARITR